MFITLLIITLLISSLVSYLVSRMFDDSINRILDRIVNDDISSAWSRYMKFAIIVVGVSSGVRIHQLERYITKNQWNEKAEIIALTPERWVLELYRTIIESLQGIAWLLLVFFVIALIAYVIVRVFEVRRGIKNPKDKPEHLVS